MVRVRRGWFWLIGCIGLQVLGACGKAPPIGSPVELSVCERSPVHILLSEGKLREAWRLLQDGSDADLLCEPGQERQLFQELVLQELGQCPEGIGECDAKAVLRPVEAALQIRELRERGELEEAQRVLDRTVFSAERAGGRLQPVPSWFQSVREIVRTEPGPIVVTHEDGTSSLDPTTLQERSRCPQKISELQLSPRGKFAVLRADFSGEESQRQGRIIDLSSCKESEWGKPLAFSSDESLVATLLAGELSVRQVQSGEVIYQLDFPIGESRAEVKGACFSSDGKHLLVAQGFGITRLISVSDGGVQWRAQLHSGMEVRNHLGVPIDPHERSCSFAQEDTAIRVQFGRGIGFLVSTQRNTWMLEAKTGQVLESRLSTVEAPILARARSVKQELLSDSRFASVSQAQGAALSWHGNALCFGTRCFFSDQTYRFRSGGGVIEENGVQVDVAEGRRFLSKGLTSDATGQLVSWQWPEDYLAETYRGPSDKVLDVVFYAATHSAWLLMENGELLEFSDQDGRLKGRHHLGQGACAVTRWSQAPHLEKAVNSSAVVLKVNSSEGCSFYGDLRTGRFSSLPLIVSGAFSVSGNGKRIAVMSEEKLTTYELEPLTPLASFAPPSEKFSLDQQGEYMVGLSPGSLSRDYMSEVPGALWFRRIDGEEPVPQIEFEDDPRDGFEPELQASAALISWQGQLYTYTGELVGRVYPRGRQAVIQYTDGTLELFGENQEAAYQCMLNHQIVPKVLCESAIVGGRLAFLNGGLPANESEAPEVPLLAHCKHPPQLCGEQTSTDALSVDCYRKPVNPQQLACLSHLRTMRFEKDTYRAPHPGSVLHVNRLVVLQSTQLSSLAAFESASWLETVRIESAPLSDISALRSKNRITRLKFMETQLTDLSALTELTNLLELNLSKNPVMDIGALAGLTQLKVLDLSDTQVRDLTPLSQLRSLRELKLTNSKVVDLSPLQSLPHLSKLDLAGMAIEDAELLSDFPQLRNVSVTPSLLSPDIMAQLKTVFPDLAMSSADYVMLTRSLPPTQAKLAQ